MRRRRFLLVMSAVALLGVVVFVLLIGIKRPLPGRGPRGITLSKFEILRVVIQEFELADLDQYQSVHEFVAVGRMRNVISAEPPDHYDTDGWERPFRWESVKADGKLIVRIISAGSNGIFGDDDDLYLWAEVSPHKPYKTTIKS